MRKQKADDIFTPQGLLREVENNPNLDLLMNIFNIPRAFGVSGFGDGWNVGMHSAASAFIALFWSQFNNFEAEKRDRLVRLSLLHDLHEGVTGDILPMFKSKNVKDRLETIQNNILCAIGVPDEDKDLEIDLKIVDLVAFIYEIKQVSPSILNSRKLKLAHAIADKQEEILYDYCKKNKVKADRVKKFLKKLDI